MSAPALRADTEPTYLLVQLLRGVAALMVVAHHASILAMQRLGGSRNFWENGAAGVDLFFVISGFVIALSARRLTTGTAAALAFMKRRVERIVPLYWIATTLKVALILAMPTVAMHGLGSPWHVLASYLFLPSYDVLGQARPVLLVGWTLHFEMLFYVCFALALLLRLRPLQLLIPLVGSLSIAACFFPQISLQRAISDPILLEFLFGIGLYRMTERGWRLPEPLCWVAVVAGFGVILSVSWADLSLWRPILWGLPALAIVMAALGLERRLRRFMARWLLELGDASYSIYLSHTFTLPVAAVLLLQMHLGNGRARWAAETFAIVLSTVVGGMVYRVVELPIIRYFKQQRAASAQKQKSHHGEER